MATLEIGQLYIPDAETARDDMLTDFYLEAKKYETTAPAVTPGTDNWLFFNAVAHAGDLQYANLASVRPALTPLFSTGQDLENWRIALGLPVVQPSPSTGKITCSVSGGAVITVPDGQRFLLPNGLRGKVVGGHPGVVDGSDVTVVTEDTGSATRAAAGTKVRWVSPPFNLQTEGKVSINAPLTGGYDAETEARKKERVLNRFANTPGGGNWGMIREIAFNALATVQNAYVYPAAGGPASEKAVICKAFDRELFDFSRSFVLSAVDLVRNAIWAQYPDGIEAPCGTTADETTIVAFTVKIPSSTLAGGNGTGWLDQLVWPPAGSQVSGRVSVSAVTNSRTFTVNAATAVAPIDGSTRVAWWSPQTMAFHVARVVSHSGSSGAWVLTVDKPMVDDTGATIAATDLISPAAVNLDAYAESFIALMENLGAGEIATTELPRRARKPMVTDGVDSEIGEGFLSQFVVRHPEITRAAIGIATPSIPTVPGSVDDPPNILVPSDFAIYPIA